VAWRAQATIEADAVAGVNLEDVPEDGQGGRECEGEGGDGGVSLVNPCANDRTL
jgi:hypothetical protein